MSHSSISPGGELLQQNADKNAADIEVEINEPAAKTTKKTKRSRGFLMRFWDGLRGRGREERSHAK